MSSIDPTTISPDILARMIDVGRRLNSTTELDVLLHQIIHEAAILLRSEATSILLFDHHSGQLRFRAMAGELAEQLADMEVPIEGSIAGQIFRSKKPLIIHNVTKNDDWNPEFDSELDFKTEMILGVPLLDSSSEPIGVLEAVNKADGNFDQEDVAVLATLADLAGVAISKAQLFEELHQAYDKLNELDRMKSDFIALASHELRTPLSIILGYVSFLREEAQDAQAKQLDHMMTAATRLRTLIQDMLNLRYVDAGETMLDLSNFDLLHLMHDTATRQYEAAQTKKQQLKFHRPKKPLYIVADRGMIEVVMSNLINNAFKFTPAHGRIDIGAVQRGQEAWIYIRDTGEGIPADQHKRIFDRFYQVEPHMRRRHEGMGLGLSIVKELIEVHNGRVWVESVEGKGSELFVVLPIKQD